MKSHHNLQKTTCDRIPEVPSWVTSGRAESLEDVAFLSGSALCHLHMVLARAEVPQILLRDRLALNAAVACGGYSGRVQSAAELRDAFHLLRPGDLPGPAGEEYQAWRHVVGRKISVKALHQALPRFDAKRVDGWLAAGQGMPVARAALVLQAVLEQVPRTESAALILADAALAQALDWDHLLPLLGPGLRPADLRKRGEALRLACHRAITVSARETVRLAAELARGVARLNASAPQLRAKGAAQALEMFRTRDAVAPAALPLPDRAARRFCDRLVGLGVVRELTGRDSFRLYGV
jgi:hypothetical protein